MSGSMVWRLVAKDLYFLRWFIVFPIIAGAGALAVMPFGRVASYVGGVSLICTLIIVNILLVMIGIVQERKDKVMLFVLSLPVSTTQYVIAKVLSNGIAFGTCWLVLTIATVLVVDLTVLPNGVLPFWMAVLCYILFYYCALLAVALLSDSAGWHATAITIGNISVNFLIPYLLSLASVRQYAEGPTAVWTADILTIIVLELAVGLVALGIALVVRTRKPDFV
jgi:ABC-type transport system involved in multi-copper enzyme maturation permease subunit